MQRKCGKTEALLLLDNIVMLAVLAGCVHSFSTTSFVWQSVCTVLLMGRFDMSIVMLTHNAGHKSFTAFGNRVIKILSPVHALLSSALAFTYYNWVLHRRHHRCNRTESGERSVFRRARLLRRVFYDPETDSDGIFTHLLCNIIAHDSVLLHPMSPLLVPMLFKIFLLLYHCPRALSFLLIRSVLSGLVFVLFRKFPRTARSVPVLKWLSPIESWKANIHVYPFTYCVRPEHELDNTSDMMDMRFDDTTKRTAERNDHVDTSSKWPILLSPSYHECYHKLHHQNPAIPTYLLRKTYSARGVKTFDEYENWYATLVRNGIDSTK